ncbi:ribonuclease P protein component [uncultured Enorma sp.]|uniref:ribonuclease P protein component n=1 Tax=uncultured Enorma sp. TaxID=1714346 RepID=UPI002591AF3D|nr:ribonuclease P protein component [uncultured Enorma sp.]
MRTIKSRLDFERVFKHGRRVNHPLVRMVICDGECEGGSGRVAFAAAKRLGNAVVRNRSKRKLREAARACALPVPGTDLILFATPKTRDARPEELAEALSGLLKRAGRRDG